MLQAALDQSTPLSEAPKKQQCVRPTVVQVDLHMKLISLNFMPQVCVDLDTSFV